MNDVGFWELVSLLGQVIAQLPWVLVMLAGGVVCLRRLGTRPRDGWLVGGAIALSLLASFGVSHALDLLWSSGLMNSIGYGPNSMWEFQLLYGIPMSITQAAAWGLILYAAFGKGSGPRSKYLIEDESPRREAD